MLQKTSEEVADCLRHAAEVDACAESTNDAKRKAEYQRIAQSWRILARSFDFQETLGRFISFDESTKNASSEPPLDIAQAAEPAPRNDAGTVLANTPFLLTRCSSDLRYVFGRQENR